MRPFFLLLLVPTILFLSIFPALKRDGIEYQGSKSDPAYIYLVGSLALRTGKTPFNWDHPGTTLTAIGAVVIWGGTAGLSAEASEKKVFERSEEFVHAILLVLSFLHAAVFALAGWLAWRSTGNLALGCFLQLFPLLHQSAWEAFTRLGPDMFTLSLGTLMLSCLLSGGCVRRRALLAGTSSGALFAAKITGLPLLLIPVVFLRRKKKDLALFLLSSAGIFFGMAWLVLGRAVPEFFSYFFSWIVLNATRSGQYGMGQPGLPDGASFFAGLLSLGQEAPLAALTLLALMVFSFASKLKERWTGDNAMILTLAISAAIQYLLVAKQPAVRYLLPAFPALGMGAGLMVRLLVAKPGGGSVVRVLFPCCVLIFLFQPVQLLYSAGTEARLSQLQEKETVLREQACRVIPFYWASGRDIALDFGNFYARGQFTKTFQELFPEFLLFDPTRGVFLDAQRKPVPAEPLLKAGKVCLRGSGRALYGGPGVPGWKAEVLYASEPDSIFLLEPARK